MSKCKAHALDAKWRSKDVMLEEKADFSSLLLSEKVLRGLTKARFQHPSPIQLEAIPTGLCGTDLVIQAKSGTGKTLVFTVIALEMLMDVKTLQVLIMAPTREVATQICDVVKTVGSSFTKLRCASFIGGLPLEEDKAKSLYCQIAVGTPGRLKQLIDLGYLQTNAVRLFVLDEADELLRASCTGDIDWIFQTLPEDKQVIAASATYPKELETIINKYFRQPYVVRLNIDELSLLGTVHYAYLVEECKMPVLTYELKLEALKKVLCAVKFSQCIVYCNLVSRVEGLCYDIQKWGFSVTHISSAKDQIDRLKAIDRLKQFKCKVLVSSDVTARGIDAENVDIIINFDCPSHTETYLHRVGRAGRYGSQGIAVTFLSENQLPNFEKIGTAGSFKVYLLSDPVPSDLITKRPDVNKAFFGSNCKKLSHPLKMFYGAEETVNPIGNSESAVVNYFKQKKFLDCHSDASNMNGTCNNTTNGIGAIPDQIQLLNENSDLLEVGDSTSNQGKNECFDSNIKCVSMDMKVKLQESQYQSNGTCDSELFESNCDMLKAGVEHTVGSLKLTQSDSKISESFESEDSKPNGNERNTVENETVIDKTMLFDEKTVQAALTCEPLNLNHTQLYHENECAEQQLTNSCSENYNEQVLEQKERTSNCSLKENDVEGPMSVLENQQSATHSKNFSEKQKGVQTHPLSNAESVDTVSHKTKNLNSESLDEIKKFVINFIHNYENQELLNANSNFEPDEECLQQFENEFASPEKISRHVSSEDVKNRKKCMLEYYYELFKEYHNYFENNLEFDSNPLKEKIHQILNEVTDGSSEASQTGAHANKAQQVLNSDNVKNLFFDDKSKEYSSEAVSENDIVNAEVEHLFSGSSEHGSESLPRIQNFYKFAEAFYRDPVEITESSSEDSSSSESSSGATDEDDNIVNDKMLNMPEGEVEQQFSAGSSEHKSVGLPKIQNFHKFAEAVHQDHMEIVKSASEKPSSEAVNEDEIVNANVFTMPKDELENLSFTGISENRSEGLPKIVDFYKFAEALNQDRMGVVQSVSQESSSEATSEDDADSLNLPKGLVENLFDTFGLESLPTVEDFFDENGAENDTPNMPKSESEQSFIAEKSEYVSKSLPVIENVHEFDVTVRQDFEELTQPRSDYVQLMTDKRKKLDFLEKSWSCEKAVAASNHNVNPHKNCRVPKELFSSETDDDDEVSFHKNYEKHFVQRNSSEKMPKYGIATSHSKNPNSINHSSRPTLNDFTLYEKNSKGKKYMNHSLSQKSEHSCKIFKNCSKMSHVNANNSTRHNLYCEPSTCTPYRTNHPACFPSRIRNSKHLEHFHDYSEFSQNNVLHGVCNCCWNSHFSGLRNSACKNGKHATHQYDSHQSISSRSKCLKPSQHRCHPVHTDTSCQSQMCSEWYELFINQWLCLKNGINFHR